MIVEKLTLTNFRNYDNKLINFDPKLNIIVGENGIGKTNILEALIVLSNTKSFRTNNDQVMIKHQKEFGKIEAIIKHKQLKIVIDSKSKNYFINDNKIKNRSFIGNINCVLFEPHDLNIFKDGPKKRRQFLDIELSKIYKNYLKQSLIYYKILKDKNNLLKNIQLDETLYESLNENLINPMYEIMRYRKHFVDYLNKRINNYLRVLINKDLSFNIKYDCCVNEISKEKIKEKIEQNKEKDLFYKVSFIGSHKEDIKFYFGDKEVYQIASQGQKKLALISLKLALVDYINEVIKEKPILLLDDILSELDIENQKRLLNFLNDDIQTIITTTDIKKINIKKEYKIIEIS